MTNRDRLIMFCDEVKEHIEDNPDEELVLLVAVAVDAETGRAWVCNHAFVDEDDLADLLDLVKQGEPIEEEVEEAVAPSKLRPN